MNCNQVIENAVDYLEGNLLVNDQREIIDHLENCEKCRLEISRMGEAISYLCLNSGNIGIPDNLIDKLKGSVLIHNKRTRPFSKRLALLVASIAILSLFVITAFATDGFKGLISWIRDSAIKESQSIQRLVENGYGQQMNLIAQDKNIIITIERVVADDINTIIVMSVENTVDDKQYIPYFNEGVIVKGDFDFPHPDYTNPLGGVVTLDSHSPSKYMYIINMDPLRSEESIISFDINELMTLEGGNQGFLKGHWGFEIPVTKYPSFSYKLNHQMNMDGIDITFEEIVVAPTATVVKYNYKNNKSFDITGIDNMSLLSNGIEYGPRAIGSDSYGGDSKGWNYTIRQFEPMYFDSPKNIEIRIGSYNAYITKFHGYELDKNKELPQKFDYMGSTFTIESITVDENGTRLIIEETSNARLYDSSKITIVPEGDISVRSQEKWEQFIIDKNDNRIDMPFGFPLSADKYKPKLYVTRRHVDLLRVFGEGDIIPDRVEMRGYFETRKVDSRTTIKLR